MSSFYCGHRKQRSSLNEIKIVTMTIRINNIIALGCATRTICPNCFISRNLLVYAAVARKCPAAVGVSGERRYLICAAPYGC